MAHITTMESQVDVKSSAESFYQIFRNKQYDLPKMCSNLIRDVQLIKGDWESVGSTRKWIFASADNSFPSEHHIIRVEAIDDKNKSMTINVIDGELKKLYNSYAFTIQAIDKGDGSGSVMKTIVECEKKNEDVPDPTKYFDFADICYKTMDAYFINNA